VLRSPQFSRFAIKIAGGELGRLRLIPTAETAQGTSWNEYGKQKRGQGATQGRVSAVDHFGHAKPGAVRAVTPWEIPNPSSLGRTLEI